MKQMGHHRQHLAMQLVMGGGHHQMKKYCIWGLGLLVPFLVLFCIFPSGTSLYRPPNNVIVVSQLEVPPLRARSHHNTVPSDEISHRKAEEKLSASSTDGPDLGSKKSQRQSDDLVVKKSKKQNVGIKAEMSRMDSSSSSSSSSSFLSEKAMNKENDALIIKTMIDKELDEQTNAEDIQSKKSSSRKGKMKQNKDKMSDTAIGEETSFLGKGDEASDIAKSTSGRKQEKEEEEISSLGKEIGANEEDLVSPKSSSSKQGVNFMSSEEDDSIADAEEAVSFKGKEKQRLRKEGFTNSGKMGSTEEEERASDLLFLENADKEAAFLMQSPRKILNKRESEQVEEEHALDDDDDSIDVTSHVIAKADTKQSGKCRYYEGRWIIDSTDPLYEESTCTLMSIEDQENCKAISNRTKPIKWRWQPSYCKMEHLKVKNFLNIMQRKSLAFVGDKLAKAQMESLVCLLAQVEKPNLVYEDKTNKSTSWHFSSSNFTISMIWSPYLVQEVDENGYKKLHLDKLDTKWAVMVPTLDVLVLGVGSLFIEPSIYMIHDEVVGCYSCKDLNTHNNNTNMKEISLYSGFRAIMRSSLMGVGAIPGFEGITLFLQPFGFEGNGSYNFVSMKMKEIQEEELYQAHKRGSISNQSKMEVLHTDFIRMSKYDNRKGPKTSTCLVPSPLADTWNQLLQHTLARILNHNSYI